MSDICTDKGIPRDHIMNSVGQSPRNSVSLPVALGLLPAKVGECRN